MKKLSNFLMIMICIIVLPMSVFAHPGRTDSSGGHHDYKNKSGLGSYHYHHGLGPHLHPGGVCSYGGDSGDTSSPAPSKPRPSISIVNAPSELCIGDNAGLEYSVDNATDSASSVVSSDENVVRVNPDRTLTAVGEGTATITVSGSGASEAFAVAVKSVPVDSITINAPSTEIQMGTSSKLEATVQPDNATDKTVTWRSSDTNILEVGQDGTVSGKGVGSAVISCQSINGTGTEVTLNVFEVFPERIACNVGSIYLESGKTQELKITVLPQNANNKNYTVEIKDKNIAKIQDNSKVIALSDGDTEIVITTDNGITQSIPIKVYHVPVESVEFDTANVEYVFTSLVKNIIDKDDDFSIKADILPDNATYKDIEWKSSNPEIMSIENNKFIIKDTGDVTISAITYDGVKKSISLKVIDKDFAVAGITLGSICIIGAAGGTGFYLHKRKQKKLSM